MRCKSPTRTTNHGKRSYRLVLSEGHPFSDKDGYVYEHRLVVEGAIGKPLDPKHPVHHLNGDGLDNRPANLVACDSVKYHQLLHRRARALESCGDPNKHPCPFCKTYDDASNMKRRAVSTQEQYIHQECANRYAAERRARKRAS